MAHAIMLGLLHVDIMLAMHTLSVPEQSTYPLLANVPETLSARMFFSATSASSGDMGRVALRMRMTSCVSEFIGLICAGVPTTSLVQGADDVVLEEGRIP
jgi:hypothetical protein